mmetsp:Transcript_19878/g.43262  ORF Transcript_19878/g.43262 Transcript_19878/m.43262 type:complete len:271 (-) Transcript_19878:1543-2355(-)
MYPCTHACREPSYTPGVRAHMLMVLIELTDSQKFTRTESWHYHMHATKLISRCGELQDQSSSKDTTLPKSMFSHACLAASSVFSRRPGTGQVYHVVTCQLLCHLIASAVNLTMMSNMIMYCACISTTSSHRCKSGLAVGCTMACLSFLPTLHSFNGSLFPRFLLDQLLSQHPHHHRTRLIHIGAVGLVIQLGDCGEGAEHHARVPVRPEARLLIAAAQGCSRILPVVKRLVEDPGGAAGSGAAAVPAGRVGGGLGCGAAGDGGGDDDARP